MLRLRLTGWWEASVSCSRSSASAVFPSLARRDSGRVALTGRISSLALRDLHSGCAMAATRAERDLRELRPCRQIPPDGWKGHVTTNPGTSVPVSVSRRRRIRARTVLFPYRQVQYPELTGCFAVTHTQSRWPVCTGSKWHCAPAHGRHVDLPRQRVSPGTTPGRR